MLILGRKPGERVFVGNDIEIVVLDVQKNRVRIGFNAPNYVPILRGELQLSQDEAGWLPALAEAECA